MVRVKVSNEQTGGEFFEYDDEAEAMSGVNSLYEKCRKQFREDGVRRAISILIEPRPFDECPFDHWSSPNGCADGCEACDWEAENRSYDYQEDQE